MGDKYRVFVIMPFAEEFNAVFGKLIKSNLEATSCIEVIRADTDLDQRNIMKDVVNGIVASDIVIADLTGNNPNVFYELGIAHGLNKPTILITQDKGGIPFDLKPYRVLEYSEHFESVETFKAVLKRVCNEGFEGKINFSNPVADFHFGETPKIRSIRAVSENDGNGLGEQVKTRELEPDDGVLDWILNLGELGPRISEKINDMNDVIDEVGQEVRAATEKMGAVQKTDRPNKYRIIRQIASDLATKIIFLSRKLKGVVVEYIAVWDGFEKNTEKFFGEPLLLEQLETEQATELKEKVSLFKEKTLSTRESLQALGNTVSSGPKISKDMNKAARELASVIGEICEVFDRVEPYSIRIVSILEKLINSLGENN